MSDDDERMDRARRIRRMREGRRDDEESTGDPDAGSTDSAETTPETDGDAAATDIGAANVDTVDAGTADAAATENGSADAAAETSAAESGGPDAETAEPSKSEIQGPATQDEWFDAESETQPPAGAEAAPTTEANTAASPEVDPVPSTEEETPTPTEADPDAIETVSSAASAAAAFEVDDPEQLTQQAQQSADEAEPEDSAAEQEEEIRVLEFRLGDEHYCLNIEHVEEIVKESSVTRVPNTPDHVHGVVDLRGQITTILDPKIALDIEDDGGEQLLIVFDAETFEDQGHAGWIVDEVRQVLPVTESEVKDSPLEHQSIKGVIEREDEFIIWTTPEVALDDGEE